MLSSRFTRAIGVGVAVLAASAAIGVSAASAAEVGTLSISPASGSYFTPMTISTSGPCPGGTNLIVRVFGSGFPALGYNVVSNTSQGIYPVNAAGGLDVPLSNHMKFFAEAQSPPVTLSGQYRLELKCQNTFGTTGFGEFNGLLNFGTPTSYNAVVVSPVTNTSISAAPASPRVQGTAVAFSSTTTAVDGALEAGSVEFFNGAVSLGAAAPVSAAGTASITTSTLPVGTNSVTAVFTSAAGPQTGSTSPVNSYVITAPAAAQGTTTALSVATPVTAGNPTALTATVAVVAGGTGTPAGSVQFFNGATSLGSSPVNASGVATLNSVFAAGPHSVTAAFTPASPALYNSSTSAPVTFTAVAPSFTPDEQTITGEIPAGTIIITTPYTPQNPLALGVLSLNAGGTMFSSTKPFNNISISDTRAGNLPWTALAFAATLTNGSGGQINGQNVGLTDLVPTYLPGNGLNAANPVVVTNHAAANPAVAPVDPGTQGLGNAPHAFAHANNGAGSVVLNGVLTLNAPSSTPAGLYTGIVTFTVVGS